jgi:SAM-dependent methyltransferase
MTNYKSSKEFFENKYSENSDPWDFATGEYELHRYHPIFNALSHNRYSKIFEPGCSIGILTEMLATIAHQVYAFDISPTAAKLAKERCQHRENVTIKCSSLKKELPSPDTDLIVLSEIGYYFTEEELLHILRQILLKQNKNSILLASHCTGYYEDHILSGDKVHEIINRTPNLLNEYHFRCANFRIDRWRLI